MDIHAVSLHSPDDSGLAGARHLDRRVTMAEAAIEAVSGADEPTLVALPAGFLRVGSKLARDTLALSLLSISRRAQVPLAFGVDVAPDDTWAPIAGAPASFAYVTDGDRPLIWPAEQVRSHPSETAKHPAERRCVDLAGERVGLVIAGEAFNGPLRRSLARVRPQLILLLAHAPPTDRWSAALAGLGAVAPTVVVDQGSARRSATTAAPTGWIEEPVVRTADLTVRRFRRAVWSVRSPEIRAAK